jgi:hypothetical protein
VAASAATSDDEARLFRGVRHALAWWLAACAATLTRSFLFPNGCQLACAATLGCSSPQWRAPLAPCICRVRPQHAAAWTRQRARGGSGVRRACCELAASRIGSCLHCVLRACAWAGAGVHVCGAVCASRRAHSVCVRFSEAAFWVVWRLRAHGASLPRGVDSAEGCVVCTRVCLRRSLGWLAHCFASVVRPHTMRALNMQCTCVAALRGAACTAEGMAG